MMARRLRLGLVDARQERSDLAHELDLSTCPYYLNSPRPGQYGPGTCMGGCWSEPSCVTDEPADGWPRERNLRAAHRIRGLRYRLR